MLGRKQKQNPIRDSNKRGKACYARAKPEHESSVARASFRTFKAHIRDHILREQQSRLYCTSKSVNPCAIRTSKIGKPLYELAKRENKSSVAHAQRLETI